MIEAMPLDPVRQIRGRPYEAVLDPKPPEHSQIGRLQFPYSVLDVSERFELVSEGQRLARTKDLLHKGLELFLRREFDLPRRFELRQIVLNPRFEPSGSIDHPKLQDAGLQRRIELEKETGPIQI